MVRLMLRALGSDAPRHLEVAATVRLRDLQALLCRMFQKSFPWYRAAIVMESAAHDHFEAQPFLRFQEDAQLEATVVFMRNTEEPFFFDIADRRGPRATALDEVEFEEAVHSGDARAIAEGCEAWAARRRLALRSPQPGAAHA